jgi:hypothetical protein
MNLNQIAQRALMGVRRYSGSAKKLLGHSNNAIKLLGATTNHATRLGYKNTPLHKANDFAQSQLAPALATIGGAIDKVSAV